MTLAFLLSMPHAASWNGKWSGQGKCYAIVTSVMPDAKAQTIFDNGPYFYRWDDGWCAEVEVRKVDAAEARRLRKASQGFCGYDWMVNSILLRGKILADHEVKAEEENPQRQTV